MVSVDEIFEDAKTALQNQTRVSIPTRSRREAQIVRAALYYRAVKSGYWWYFNVIGGTEIMISRGKK